MNYVDAGPSAGWLKVPGVLLLLASPMVAQAPFITSVYNAFNNSAGVCPGSIAEVSYSESLAEFNSSYRATFTIGTESVPLIGVSEGTLPSGSAIAFGPLQIPWDVPSGSNPLVVSQEISPQLTLTSSPFEMTTSAYCPAIAQTNGGSISSSFIYFSGSYLGLGGTATGFTQTSPAHPGDTVFMLVNGMGPTNPPNQPLDAVASAPTAATPVVMIGNTQAQVLSCNYLAPNISVYFGLYELVLVIPSNFPAGTAAAQHSVTVTIGGVSSPTTPVVLAGTATSPAPALWIGPSTGASAYPKILAVQNPASYLVLDTGDRVAPNTFASAYVTNLGNVTSPANIFPATTFQGIQVLINGTAVPLYNLATSNSVTQITFATPPATATLPKTYDIVVQSQGQTDPLAADTYSVAATPVAPSIFRIPDPKNPALPSQVNGAIQIAGTLWDVMPASLAAEYGLQACTGLSASSLCGQPASPGASIVIYLSGAGLATPNGNPNGQGLASGTIAPTDGSVLYETTTTPTVLLGGASGVPAQVTFSGIVPGAASLYQINATLPAQFTGLFQPGNSLPLVVSMNGATDEVSIAVANP